MHSNKLIEFLLFSFVIALTLNQLNAKSLTSNSDGATIYDSKELYKREETVSLSTDFSLNFFNYRYFILRTILRMTIKLNI